MKLHEVRALVVDDNQSDRMIVSAMLKALSVKLVQEAENGVIAQAKMKTAIDMGTAFNLIVLDWNMPSMDGQRLLQQIQKTAHTALPKLIVMTGDSDTEVVLKAIGGGTDDFIVKPVTLVTLKEKILKI